MKKRIIISIGMTFNYPLYITGFGTAVVFFLWFRDVRIFYRTCLQGYRTAAYQGVIFGAIALLALSVALWWSGQIFLAYALVLLALYLQGRVAREKDIWEEDSSAIDRLLGNVPTGKTHDTP